MLTTRQDHSCNLVKDANGKVRPDLVFDYNKTKKGVDVLDQIGAYLSVLRKTVKWYKNTVLELFCSRLMVSKKWEDIDLDILNAKK
jgi:hypothetical protein